MHMGGKKSEFVHLLTQPRAIPAVGPRWMLWSSQLASSALSTTPTPPSVPPPPPPSPPTLPPHSLPLLHLLMLPIRWKSTETRQGHLLLPLPSFPRRLSKLCLRSPPSRFCTPPLFEFSHQAMMVLMVLDWSPAL